MTEIDTFRIDTLQKGIIIQEDCIIDNLSGLNVVNVKMFKCDSKDGLRFSTSLAMKADIYGTDLYLDSLRTLVYELENSILRRSTTNPNRCSHETLVHNGNRICKKCYTVLGIEITLGLNFN